MILKKSNILLGVVTLAGIDYLMNATTEPVPAWKMASSNGADIVYSTAIEHNVDISPTMRFSCRNSKLRARVVFGVPLKNSYQGTQYTLATVTSQVDNNQATTLGFSISQDRTALFSTDQTSLSGGIKSLGVGIDNIIFDLIGIKNRPRMSWTPQGLADSLSTAKRLRLETKAANGSIVTAVFDVSDFYAAYLQLPSECTNGFAN